MLRQAQPATRSTRGYARHDPVAAAALGFVERPVRGVDQGVPVLAATAMPALGVAPIPWPSTSKGASGSAGF